MTSQLPASTRRKVLATGAWATPVLVLAAPALPASASTTLVPDLTVSGPPVVANGGAFTYELRNVGDVPTDGSPITFTVSKPDSGTLTVGTLPAGWSSTTDADGNIVFSSTAVVNVYASPADAVMFPFTFTPSTTTTPSPAPTVTGIISAGSGGESDGTNNAITTSLPAADLTVKVTSSSPTPEFNVPIDMFYTFTNVGTAATTGQVTFRIRIPPIGLGTFTATAIPPGFTLTTTTGSYYFFTSDQVLQPDESVTFTYSYTNTFGGTGIVSFSAIVVPPSGGEFRTNNNSSSISLRW